jgi:acyl carrier protein
MTITERLITLINEYFGSDVTLSTKFVDDLGADSLDMIDIIMEVEEEFDIALPDETNLFTTVGDAVSYLEAHGAQ